MVEIIAELGKNFITKEKKESFDILLNNATLLVMKAKIAGCKIVKFQVHKEDEIHPVAKLISPHFNKDRKEWVKRCMFPVSFWNSIKDYCDKWDMEFLATPMSRGAAELLDEVGVDRWKIGSADITDFVLLDYVRDSGKPVILSSGMSTLDELRNAYDYIKEKVKDITILHCVSLYPCPIESLNLDTILFLQKCFPDAKIGFSDHSLGLEGSLMAVELGATVIEKHFTLDRNAFGPDHKVSLEPREMMELISFINFNYTVEPTKEARGVYGKFIQEEEKKYIPAFRKKLFASRDIQKGELFESDMFLGMRADFGCETSLYPILLGKQADKNYKKYDAFA